MRNIYSNHGLVLMRIWIDPNATLAEIAADIGVRERAVYLIVRDMANEGFIVKDKVGRRNKYNVNIERALDVQPLPGVTIREQIIALARVMGMSMPEAPAPVRPAAYASAEAKRSE